MTEAPLDADRARARLYELMGEETDFETKAARALELGCAYLDVDGGALTRIDPRTDHWEAVVSAGAAESVLPAGTTLDLANTFCRHAFDRETPFALHDVAAEGWADDPAFGGGAIGCYHGTAILVDGERFGTLCFASATPRSEPFTEAESAFAELIGRLLEHELERKRHQAALERREHLIDVLNRVLRHNLRNDLTVVRGQVNRIVEAAGGDADGARDLIETVDDLIELGEKARLLNAVVADERDPRTIAIDAVLERIADDVEADHPATTITVAGADGVTLTARPAVERALREVITNAAIHGGDAPTVEITVDADAHRVAIAVRDDGPGLPDQERAVLQEGVETPLVHGSGLGLWLVHWIVSGHGGTVDASADEDGSRVELAFPRRLDVEDAVPDRPDEHLVGRGHDRFRAVFEEAFDAIVVVDDDHRFTDANSRAAELFGESAPDLLGRRLDEFCSEASESTTIWNDDGGERGTLELSLPDGTERVVEYGSTTDVVPGQHLAVLRDVTERREREAAIEAERRKFRSLAEGVNEVVYRADPETLATTYVNRAAEDVFGHPRAEWEDDPDLWVRSIHPEDRAATLARFDELQRTRESGEVEYRIVRPDGEVRRVRDSVSWTVDDDGDVTAMIGVVHEVREAER